MIKSKKQMFIVIGVFTLVLMLGTVTYAFFNYTRTGTANTIKTGRIAFNAEQGDTVTLDGLFPITTTGEITSSTPGVGSLSIHVTGDTTYNEGIEYIVKAVNVTGSNGTELPISVKIDYTANNNKTIGTADDSYYDNRGGNSSIYKLLSTDTIEDNGDLVVGYIAPGQTGIDGNITIMAWLDASNIAITDTIEGGNIEVPGYDNGTDTDWIDNRTVFTTDEWNALTANGVSFQVRVEANEGVWVEEPIPTAADTIGAIQTLETTPYGKVYSGIDPNNYIWFNDEQWRIIGVYGDKLKIMRATALSMTYPYHTTILSNEWSGSHLQSETLYNNFYPTLSNAAKEMIEENASWNVGEVPQSANAPDAYDMAVMTSWTGKVGIISGYEYMYAAENDGTCWSQSGYYFGGDSEYADCKSKDWMFNILTVNGTKNAWTINPRYNEYSSSHDHAVLIYNNGDIGAPYVYNNNSVTPVVYLKSNVIITGGNGQIGETNSYKLG